jgi:hypothetical protein
MRNYNIMAKKRGRKKKRDRAEEIKDLRTLNYRQTPDLIIKTEDDAVDFIKEIGVCLLFPADKIELPNLLQGVYGMPHPMISDSHWDEETMWTWKIKDTLPEKAKAFYGKFIMDKGTFLSPNLLTYFYSILNLSSNPDNYVSLYQTGEINQTAKAVADLILEKGSLSANSIKKYLKMNTRKALILFQQAIASLQSNLIITNYGTEIIDGKLPSTKYELVSRVFFDEVGRAQQILPEEARKMIIKKYISIVVHTNEKEVSNLFGWNYKIVESIFKELLKEEQIKEINIDDEIGYFCSEYESLAS